MDPSKNSQAAYPYYRPTKGLGLSPSIKSPAVSHYSPLSTGGNPYSEGPQPCVFSTPAFHYSPQTEELVTQLAKESRLTFSQQSGFHSLLRSGQPLPSSPADIARQQLYRLRHEHRARGILPQLQLTNTQSSFSSTTRPNNNNRFFGIGGRKKEETIRREMEADQRRGAVEGRRYIPVDKEKEKERFAHNLAFGKNPPSGRIKIETPKATKEVSRLEELIVEVGERVEFLEEMRQGKSQRAPILGQIQDLLREMKGLEKDVDWVEYFKLDTVDPCFAKPAKSDSFPY